VAEQLLARCPALINTVAIADRTILDLALTSTPPCSDEFITRLWQRIPEALHAENMDFRTPFSYAVSGGRDFQWKSTFDEVQSAFVQSSCPERMKPLIDGQCELLVEWLPREVLGTVYEYLGLPSQTQICKSNELNPFRLRCVVSVFSHDLQQQSREWQFF